MKTQDMALIGGAVALFFFGNRILGAIGNIKPGGGGGGGTTMLDLSNLFGGLSFGGGSTGGGGGGGLIPNINFPEIKVPGLPEIKLPDIPTPKLPDIPTPDLSGIWDAINTLTAGLTGLTGIIGLGGGGGGGGSAPGTPGGGDGGDVWTERMDAAGNMVSNIGTGVLATATGLVGGYAVFKTVQAVAPGLKPLAGGLGRGIGGVVESGGGLVSRAVRWGTSRIPGGQGGGVGTGLLGGLGVGALTIGAPLLENRLTRGIAEQYTERKTGITYVSVGPGVYQPTSPVTPVNARGLPEGTYAFPRQTTNVPRTINIGPVHADIGTQTVATPSQPVVVAGGKAYDANTGAWF